MFETSHIELSRSALENNLRFLREILGEQIVISSVVKGNAYGHGIEEYVPLVQACGLDHFATFSADEAFRVKQVVRPGTQIMIMGMVDHEQLEWAVENDVAFFVFEPDRLRQATRAAEKLNRRARIHLEVETGMNRTGFVEKDLPPAMEWIRGHSEQLMLEGLCTHFAGAESVANYLRVKQQWIRYRRIRRLLKEQELIPRYYHTACSAAAMRYPATRLDLARIGIIMYGLWPNRETFIEFISDKADRTNPLQRVISWKSRVMDVKEVKTGEYIGYGTSYLANKDMEVATVPVGYAHGFGRSLSNHGRVLVHGKRMPVVGTVNMNAIMVDVSTAENVRKGDEVVLIGYQGEAEMSVASFGEFSYQVNYELLTRLPSATPRLVVE